MQGKWEQKQASGSAWSSMEKLNYREEAPQGFGKRENMNTLKIGIQGRFLVLGARRMLTFYFLRNSEHSAEWRGAGEGHSEAANYVVNPTQNCWKGGNLSAFVLYSTKTWVRRKTWNKMKLNILFSWTQDYVLPPQKDCLVATITNTIDAA